MSCCGQVHLEGSRRWGSDCRSHSSGSVISRGNLLPVEFFPPILLFSFPSTHTTSISHEVPMGRSAKVTKRPSKKEKAASKTARAANRPLPPPRSPPPTQGDGEGGSRGPKKRKMMRAKADKVDRLSWSSRETQLIVE